MSYFESEIPSHIDNETKLRNYAKMLAKDVENFALNKGYARDLLNNAPNKTRARIALKCLETALRQKGDTEAELLIIRALRVLGEYKLALEQAEKVNMRIENSATLYNEFGRIFLEQNELDLAREKLEEGLKKFPDDEKLMRSFCNYLGCEWSINHNDDLMKKSLHIANRGIRMKPNEKRFVQDKFFALINLGKRDEAQKILETFQEEYESEFFELMFTDDDIPTSLALILSHFHYKEAAKLERQIRTKEKDGKDTSEDISYEPQIKLHHDESLILIDSAVDRYPDYDYSFFLTLKMFILEFYDRFEDGVFTCDAILANGSDNLVLYWKGVFLQKLERFEMGISVCDQLLSEEESTNNEIVVRELRFKCLMGLGKNDGALEEEKIIKKLKLKLERKSEEEGNDKGQQSNTLASVTEASLLEALDVTGNSGNQYFNSPYTKEENKKKWFGTWEDKSHTVSWKDDYVDSRILKDILKNVDFKKSKIRKVRILNKAYNYGDKGEECYKRFIKIINLIKLFNEESDFCKFEYRIFFTENASVTNKDPFHVRYLFDNEIVTAVPGCSQIYVSPKGDIFRDCRPVESHTVRVEFDKTWDNAFDPSSESFLKEFIRYLLTGKNKDCADLIKKNHPETYAAVAMRWKNPNPE